MSRRRLICVLVAVLCLPAAALAWLGIRLLELDRVLESQRRSERREQAADLAIQTLAAFVSDPSLTAREPGSGALVVAIPGGQRLFHARPALPKEAAAGIFSSAEQ
ncbi:MAG: hypothetical protein JNN08_24090, partial [Bryobacterales bacterium]|nr:hypothetical protein [Bryobacterales bacterium]